MPSNATPAFGDVVLVPFPFTNQTVTKKRPAVVVSSRTYATERPDVILMAITSQLRASRAFGEVWLRDWQSAGLLKPSAIKPILSTFEQTLIIRQLGTMSDEDQRTLADVITQIMGVALPPVAVQSNPEKIDDAVLALLLLGLHDDSRVWKSFDWDALGRLHDKGFISEPKGKAKSVTLTETGQLRAERLFSELFGPPQSNG